MLECSHTIQAWCSEESKKWFDLALNRFSRLNLKGFPTEAIRGALARNSKREIGISYGNLQRAYGGNRTAFEGCFLVANVSDLGLSCFGGLRTNGIRNCSSSARPSFGRNCEHQCR